MISINLYREADRKKKREKNLLVGEYFFNAFIFIFYLNGIFIFIFCHGDILSLLLRLTFMVVNLHSLKRVFNFLFTVTIITIYALVYL